MCFNVAFKSALYSLHSWYPNNNKGGLRCSWTSARTVNDLYTGRPEYDRGHLTPNADIMSQPLRSCTFKYENAAPQASYFNRGLWKLLEDKIRDNYDEATIITGTSNGNLPMFPLEVSSQYENIKVKNNLFFKLQLEYYLSSGPERLIRIPLFFWKIVIDRSTSFLINKVCVHIGF
jgi:DNA/RNA endonuclease G (NUC1)